jgi:ABC-type molybdenum transport system ATPase subunit/photorepair protein PhrA
MATKNPRVVGYVSPENHDQLKEFVKQQGLTESKAIDVIFSQFFGTASALPSSTPQELSERVAVLEQQMAEVMGECVA